jgi:putative DNA primase/helicase
MSSTSAALLAHSVELRKEEKTAVKNGHGNGNGSKTVLPPIEYDRRYDDVATAERFLADWGEEICYQAEPRKWMVWDGRRWKIDNQEGVFGLAVAFAKDLYSPEIATSSEGMKYAQRANNNAGLNAFLTIAQKKKTLPTSAFDTQPYLINCANGTLDLRTGELHPHDRKQFLTKIVDAEHDPDALKHAPAFKSFLETIQPDPEIRAFLQRSIGYSLLGTVRERSFWILYGIGNNGKSIFLNLFNRLLGDYASGTTAGSIMAGKGSQIPNDIARLVGKRFVIIPETEENEKLNAALVKALSAGDTVTARFLFGEFFDFDFTGKLWIATNHKPTITDHSKGFWDRLKVVPFSQNIPAAKLIKSDDLMAQLMAERNAVFAWAVQGCRDYFATDGLHTPPVIQAEIDSYRWEQDSIAQFLDVRCELFEQARARAPDEYFNHLDYRVANPDLYEAYEKFCKKNGEYVRSQRRFSIALKERGFRQGNSGGRYWDGVRLLADDF